MGLAVSLTVCLETGIQNTMIAFAIISLGFKDLSKHEMFQAQLFPIMWGIIVLLEGTLVCILFKCRLRYISKTGGTADFGNDYQCSDGQSIGRTEPKGSNEDVVVPAE